ncbi:hypothetical protein [Wenyingzhuangia sp. 2_MG-2023]|uniref:hypothetical protein n=1 Tax=Wenyingzhuangia sp. 2_MG-2023 TaxID=3062639 RepID=UPI0026E37722|nr:hypothetical protein [Wenyingzhuangia sp. 2_MG-2023]MDO6739335.1 hypothetical protein [Wenyingzhuangia sp. 2_MG-2023]
MNSDLNIELHDSEIIKVKENTLEDTLNFIIEYPVDFNKNIFEKRILRFFDYLNYSVKEIPFATRPIILSYENFGKINYVIGTGRNKIKVSRYKTVINTNAGTRSLEYNKFELLKLS